MSRLLLIAVLSFLCQAPARAEPAQRPVLEVVATGARGPVAALAQRIRALEARFGLSLHWTERAEIDVRAIVARQAETQGVFARVWLDLSDPQRALLFIANAGNDRLLVRVLPARGGYGELTQESLATIVESAVDALLAGGQIGVERSAAIQEIEAHTGKRVSEAPAAPVAVPRSLQTATRAPLVPWPPAAETQKAVSRRSFSVAGAYRADLLDAGPALRHGVSLALSYTGFFEPRFDLLLGVSALYLPPFSLGAESPRVSQQGGGARVVLGATGRLRSRFVWQAALVAGADVMRVQPVIAAQSELSANAPFLATLPIVGAFLSAAVRILPWIELQLGLGCDLDLSGHHFDVSDGQSRTRVISPWRAHPYGFLGIVIPLVSQAGGSR